jgi:hypothetical protein
LNEVVHQSRPASRYGQLVTVKSFPQMNGNRVPAGTRIWQLSPWVSHPISALTIGVMRS